MKTFAKTLLAASLSLTSVHAFANSGTYSDPVPAELGAYAIFPVSVDVTTDSTGTKTLSYSLPGELVGAEPFVIEFQQNLAATPSDGLSIPFDGPLASAVCNRMDSGALLCLVSYNFVTKAQFAARSEAMEAFVAARSSTVLELQSRLHIARLFATEPAGILLVNP